MVLQTSTECDIDILGIDDTTKVCDIALSKQTSLTTDFEC